MKIARLSLVLHEFPAEYLADAYYRWSNSRSIDSLRFFNRMVEVTFSDGGIKVFNEEETNQMFDDCSPFLRDVLSMIESRDNN